MPDPIFGLFSKFIVLFITQIYKINELADKRKDTIAQAAGVHPYFADSYLAYARNFPLSRLDKVVGILNNYDLRSKGIDNKNTGEHELMLELIYKLMH